MRIKWLSGPLILSLFPLAVSAQGPAAPAPAPGYKYVYGAEDQPDDPLAKPPGTRTPLEVARILELGDQDNIDKLAILAGGPAIYKKFLKAIEDTRLDKQTGATSSSEGTTSL